MYEVPDPRGEILNNRWVIEDRLGEGGMGRVFKIRALSGGDLMAVKILHSDISDPTLRARFEREGLMLSRLKHPHIVQMMEFTFDPAMGGFYLIMELLTGVSLAQILGQRMVLSSEDVLIIARQVAQALEEIHSHNIIHRDIKPTNINIQLDNRGQLHTRLFDFGIAKSEAMALDALTDPGQRIGTVQYMSPEQALADRVDRRSDLYSLGVLLYELVAGQPPFMGSAFHVLNAHASMKAPDLRLRWKLKEPVVPRIVSLIHELLHKDPDARPQSASAVLETLQAMAPPFERPKPDLASISFRAGYHEALKANDSKQNGLEKTTLPD